MPKKKYIVSLTPEERQELEQLTKKGKNPAYKVNHARILLKADINQSQGGWTDREIGESLDIGHATIERVRQRFVEEGLESALNRRKQQKRRRKIIDGEKEAYLIAISKRAEKIETIIAIRLIRLLCGQTKTGAARSRNDKISFRVFIHPNYA